MPDSEKERERFADREVAIGDGKSEIAEPISDERTRFRQTREWLDENRAAYAGKWVALNGNRLLISDSDAKVVFAFVRGLPEPALVRRVEEQEIHMGGW